MTQLHKKFTDSQVKELFDRYVGGEIKREHVEMMLNIGKAHFFRLLKRYRQETKEFSIQYNRKKATRGIDKKIERNIIKELKIDKGLIDNSATPVRAYNYSFIKDRLRKKKKQEVSLPTIINRAKRWGYYLKKKQRKTHDREVLTKYAGELIQHDSSYHLFAPKNGKKWCLITSLDDFSRYLLYAVLIERESTWAHIEGLQAVMVTHGFPANYYVDCHSIFRFVRGRDEIHYRHHLKTDEAIPQWKKVLNDCHVKVVYALSPQAKGKVERPYRWIQDHLVRICMREGIKDIKEARTILKQEIKEYNHKRVHSTTKEIPYIRFQRAKREGQTLFRAFEVPKPYKSVRDIFCYRINRRVDGYRKVSINNNKYRVNKANPWDKLELRIYPVSWIYSEIRFWRGEEHIDTQRIKNTELKELGLDCG